MTPTPPLLTARLLALLALVATLSSCVRYRDLVMFNETTLPEGVPQAILDSEPIVIQKSDLLRITVSSFEPAAVAPFNLEPPGQSPGVVQNLDVVRLFSGYMVDSDGFVDFPVLGQIKASGRTIEELKADIRQRLTTYLKEPVVNVRFLNFKVSVMGSVTTPGQIEVTNPRITLLQAIAQAGDFNDYADRDEVLVIREREGERTFARINLHSDELFSSEYYFLEQNDVVYVPPTQTRTAAVQDQGQRVVQYGSAILSLGALLVAIFR